MTRRHLVVTTLFLSAAMTALSQEAPGTDGQLQTKLQPKTLLRHSTQNDTHVDANSAIPTEFEADGPTQAALETKKVSNLTIDDVLALHEANISDNVIVAQLTQQNHPMTLSTDDLIQLKKSGISDPVVRAMLAPSTTLSEAGNHITVRNETTEKLHSMSPTGATPYFGTDTSEADFNNPLAPHESGIYLAESAPDGSTKLVYIDRITSSGESVGGMLSAMATFGVAPLWMKFNIPNGKASTRTNASDPVFYFYFDDRAAGLGKTPFAAASASSPTQFQLERMSGNKKQRQLLAAKVGITGAKIGGNVISFHVERLHPGLYKVTPEDPLKPGEYAFLLQNPNQRAEQANNPTPPDIFDFGVDTP